MAKLPPPLRHKAVRPMAFLRSTNQSLAAKNVKGLGLKSFNRSSTYGGFFHSMVNIGGLGPGGLDSDWIPENERDCYVGAPRFESQPTNFPLVEFQPI